MTTYPKYQITRTFGVSSLATHYEYVRVSRGEYGEKTYKTFRLTAASHRRIFALIDALGQGPSFSGHQVKGVTRITRYNKILKVVW